MSGILMSHISPLFLAFSGVLAAAVTLLLYYKASQSTQLTKRKVYLLAALRFLGVFLIGALLLPIVFQQKEKIVRKPMLVLAMDNSQSMADYPGLTDLFQELKEGLSDDYQVQSCYFDTEVNLGEGFNWQGEASNLGALFAWPKANLSHENTQKLLVITDGIYNQGRDPLGIVQDMKIPVYPIAVGDTQQIKDIWIEKLDYNESVFVGNTTPVFTHIKASGLAGSSATVQLWRKDKMLAEQVLQLRGQNYFEKLLWQVKAEEEGLLSLQLRILPVSAEENIENNTQALSLIVRDDKKKVLFLSAGLHPDAGAFRRPLQKNPAFDFTQKYLQTYVYEPNDYHLVILHDLPAKGADHPELNKLLKSQTPLLFILGQNTDLERIHGMVPLFEISNSRGLSDDVHPALNTSFSLFDWDLEQTDFDGLAPLNVPFGDYKPFPSSYVLLYQQKGKVATGKPLLAFATSTSRKAGFLMGEGLWRWTMNDYFLHQSHERTEKLILKTVHYLVEQEPKHRIELDYKLEYASYEKVAFTGRIYNASYALTTKPELTLLLQDSSGSKYPYVFSRKQAEYRLNMGSLPKGHYSFRVSANLGDTLLERAGSFRVIKSNLEAVKTQANHRTLQLVAAQTGGKMFFPDQYQEILEQLNRDARPVTQVTTHFSSLIHNKWWFVCVLILLTLEWFLRKFWGGI